MANATSKNVHSCDRLVSEVSSHQLTSYLASKYAWEGHWDSACRFTTVYRRGENRSDRLADAVLCADEAAHGSRKESHVHLLWNFRLVSRMYAATATTFLMKRLLPRQVLGSSWPQPMWVTRLILTNKATKTRGGQRRPSVTGSTATDPYARNQTNAGRQGAQDPWNPWVQPGMGMPIGGSPFGGYQPMMWGPAMPGMMGPGPAMPPLPLPADWQDADDGDMGGGVGGWGVGTGGELYVKWKGKYINFTNFLQICAVFLFSFFLKS